MCAQKELEYNPYEILTLSENATEKEIRRRYFFLSRTFHPDKQPRELYEDTSKYFEEIETAYKILSTPLMRFIYDNYGIEGVHLYKKKPQKFYEYEDEFSRLIKQHELQNNMSIEESQILAKEDTNIKLKNVKKKIKTSLEYIAIVSEENNVFSDVTREISVEMGLNLEEFVNYYITKEMMLIQENHPRKIYPKLRPLNFGLRNSIALPSIHPKKIIGVYQHLITFSTSQNQKLGTPILGFRYNFSTILAPGKYDIALRGGGSISNNSEGFNGINFGCSKELKSGLGISVGGNWANQNKVCVVGLSKSLGDDIHTNAQLQISDYGSSFQIGTIKEFSNPKFKLEASVEAFSDRFKLAQGVTKHFTKKLTGQASLNTILHKAGILFTCDFGFKYKLSSYSKFHWKTFLSPQAFGFDFSYQRLGLNVHLPIVITKRFEPKSLILNTLFTIGFGYLTHCYDKWRKVSSTRRRKLEEMNKIRLTDSKKVYMSKIVELSTEEFMHNVFQEAEQKGLVILKALYGRPHLIHKEFKKELKTHGHKHIINFEGSVMQTFQNDRQQLNDLHLEATFSEMLDLQVPLQVMVINSRLRITPRIIKNIPGIFNPCIDEDISSHIFLKIYLKDKIYMIYLDENQSVDIDPDFELNFTSPLKETFNLRNFVDVLNPFT